MTRMASVYRMFLDPGKVGGVVGIEFKVHFSVKAQLIHETGIGVDERAFLLDEGQSLFGVYPPLVHQIRGYHRRAAGHACEAVHKNALTG